MVKVYLEREDKTIDIEFSGKLKDLIKQLNIPFEAIVATRDGEVLTEEDKIDFEDSIELLSVISGG